nr:DNA adenine methylase [Chloroflexus sp.]
MPACHSYWEPFGGSAAVLLNRDPAPVATYHDIDGDVVNFFRVLRDHYEELTRAIALTPFSREEFYLAMDGDDHDILELRPWIRYLLSITGATRRQTFVKNSSN